MYHTKHQENSSCVLLQGWHGMTTLPPHISPKDQCSGCKRFQSLNSQFCIGNVPARSRNPAEGLISNQARIYCQGNGTRHQTQRGKCITKPGKQLWLHWKWWGNKFPAPFPWGEAVHVWLVNAFTTALGFCGFWKVFWPLNWWKWPCILRHVLTLKGKQDLPPCRLPSACSDLGWILFSPRTSHFLWFKLHGEHSRGAGYILSPMTNNNRGQN